MKFLAEDFEVSQSCSSEIPSLLIENWGTLHEVLFSG